MWRFERHAGLRTSFVLGVIICSAACGAGGDDEPNRSGAGSGGQSASGGSGGNEAGGGTAGAPSSGASTGAGTGGGSGSPGPCAPDESAGVPDRTLPGIWQKVELPGTLCGNDSQYKFFVNYSTSSNNLIVNLEPGGACWDYGSCAGDGGLRGAANPDGIPDNHMTQLKWEFLPLHRRDSANPLRDWNMVFVPYCTGDLHTGNNRVTYENPDPGGSDLVFDHHGHQNMTRLIAWIAETFPEVPRLLVTGCSAGGTGALVNYHFIRKGLPGVQCSYLLDDSGPIFPGAGNSGPLHAQVRAAWNLDPLIDEVAADFAGLDAAQVKADLGLINTALADKYPRDRLATTLYRLDFNYSLYSYERFHDMPSQAEIHRLWWEDIQLLMEQYDTRDNLAYFIPYYRNDNCSHCVTIPPVDSGPIVSIAEPYRGSEIQASGVDIRDFVELLTDDQRPLESFIEGEQPGELLSPERAAECQAL
jgi:hypothetical protein